jgi:cytoskeletal protein RodZ
MPETRGERLLFVAGLLLIAFLIAAIAFRPKSSDPARASKPPTTTTVETSTAYPPPATTTVGQTTTAPATSTKTAETTTTTEATGEVELRVAARDDTWLSIRGGSATGEILFEGTLAKGDSRRYSATRFHVRFGAAANVTATLDGKPLSLPSGTYSVTIGPGGLGARSA